MKHQITDLSPEQKNWLWIGFSVLLLTSLATYKFLHSGVPYFSTSIANALPPSIYQSLDKSTLVSLDDSQFEPSTLTPEQKESVSELFNSLIQNDADQNKNYQLKFRQWQEQPNAMALANGTIIITDSMYKLADNDIQLASILLHEIGHVEHNHVMENLIGSSIITVSFSLLFGDISVLADILLQGTILGINQSYSKEAELEADAYAAKHLNNLYGSTDAMALIFEKLEKQAPSNNTWLSSHPEFSERIKEISK